MQRIKLALGIVLVIAASIRAEVKTEPVEYKQGDTTLKGMIAYDDATKDKRPGVIVVHEWWGLTEHPKNKAIELTKLGYVTFAIDMFGDGKTTEDPKQAGEWAGAIKKDRETAKARFMAAMDVLRKNERVDAQKIGAIGFCFGGTVVLEAARHGAPLAGVVSFHGALETQNPAASGAVKAHILICHGADDPMVTPDHLIAFAQEMGNANVDYQINVYSDAVHAFTNPKADSFKIPGIAYNEKADKRSWEAMKDFFAEVFK